MTSKMLEIKNILLYWIVDVGQAWGHEIQLNKKKNPALESRAPCLDLLWMTGCSLLYGEKTAIQTEESFCSM